MQTPLVPHGNTEYLGITMATVELSVFGLGSQVDVTSETLALAGVVGFTVVFEMAAHRLEHRLSGTPYMGMLAKIYKGKFASGFTECKDRSLSLAGLRLVYKEQCRGV